jgi:flagellar biosynthesis protein FlhF
MINGHTETKTYRGESLEELLPKIADDLGPDAVITRQRDGIVGGIGGFFGKKVLEVEARPGTRPPAMPASALLDAYDDGAPYEPPAPIPIDVAAEIVGEVEEEADEIEEHPTSASSFAALVDELAARPPVSVAPEPELVEEPEPVPAPAPSTPANPIYEGIGVGHSLVWAGLSSEPVASLIGSVLRHSSLFSADKPLTEQVKAALAQQIPVSTGWTQERHVLAVIGPAGCGRTHAAAAIAQAYSNARISSAVLSLESPRTALGLGTLLEAQEVGFDIAPSLDEVDFALSRLSSYGLIVVDTPAFANTDANGIEKLARLLEKVGVDAVHLLCPAGVTADAAGAMSTALAGRIDYTHIMVSQLNKDTRVGGAVGLAIGTKRPISYLMSDEELRVPDAFELAERVLV